MSVPVNGVVRRNGGGRLPDGTEVASYGSYEEALAALEVLASNDFEVEQVSVVGTDLYSVERIMGRVTWARAVSSAVMNGALWGAMIGIVLSINQGNTMVWVGACMLAGAFMTACLSTSLFFMRRRRRDFYSQSQVLGVTQLSLPRLRVRIAFVRPLSYCKRLRAIRCVRVGRARPSKAAVLQSMDRAQMNSRALGCVFLKLWVLRRSRHSPRPRQTRAKQRVLPQIPLKKHPGRILRTES